MRLCIVMMEYPRASTHTGGRDVGLARGVWGGAVHLIDTCDIPCVFFVIVSLVWLSKTFDDTTPPQSTLLLAEIML